MAYGEATLAGLGVVEYAPASDAAFGVRRFTNAVLAASASTSTLPSTVEAVAGERGMT
ncbi:MAG: hypothetical protein ABSC94_28885 [Polyangiaceae bacterium]